MENTVVNNEIMEVVEDVADELIIDDISKSNIVESVKSIARNCSRNFKMIDSNESGFRNELDILEGKLEDLYTMHALLQKRFERTRKVTALGFIMGGVGLCALELFVFYNKNKNTVINDTDITGEE